MASKTLKIEKAALYARVSTKDKGQDTENQLVALREYCKRQEWEIVEEFVDRETGRRSDSRAQFQRLFAAASRREFDVVVVWALDRLSREGVMQTFEHIKRLREYRVEFESYQEPHFRTTGGAGDLMIALAAWIAEQESKRMGERTKAGMERARREGKHIGRPRKILDRDRVRKLHAEGKSMREIGKQLKISAMTACRIVAA